MSLAPTLSSGQDRQDLIDDVDLVSLGMQGARLQSYEPLDELAVWSVVDPLGTTCLLVRRADVEGLVAACESAPRLPTLDLRVGDAVRSEEVGRLAIGSTVRFALNGQQVEVRVTPAETP